MCAHTLSHKSWVQRKMCSPNQWISEPCCILRWTTMFWRQAWNYAKHGNGWDEKRKRGERGERKRGSGFPNHILLHTCPLLLLLLLFPCIRKCLMESLIHRFLQLEFPLFCGLLALRHFLDHHFQMCAAMCAEPGVVESPMCWLLYPIMPLVL